MEHACRQVRGLIRLAKGDPPGALADATIVAELANQTRDVEALLPALAFHARALLANRRIQDAGARADDVLAILADRGALVTTPDWSGQLAVVLHALGRGRELLELAAGVAARPAGYGPRPPSRRATSSRPPTAMSRSGRCPTRRSPASGPPSSSSAPADPPTPRCSSSGAGLLPSGRRDRLPAGGRRPGRRVRLARQGRGPPSAARSTLRRCA